MLRFILTKLALLIPTFFGVTLFTFFMIRLIPGDPIEVMVGERGIPPSGMPCCARNSVSTGPSTCNI